MMVSRITYFPSILEKVDSQFRRTAGADIHDGPWLEYKGEPLKWWVPPPLAHTQTREDQRICCTMAMKPNYPMCACIYHDMT